jgi:hypothetical protein
MDTKMSERSWLWHQLQMDAIEYEQIPVYLRPVKTDEDALIPDNYPWLGAAAKRAWSSTDKVE